MARLYRSTHDPINATIAKWKRGKYASVPTFTAPFCEYNRRNATVNDDHATLATVDGRITAEYVLPDEHRDTPQSKHLLNDDYETTGATLHYRNGSFYLHVRTKADVDAPERPENGTGLGVDLGVENGCSYIAFENLTDVRDRMPRARKFHEWAFRRLYGYIEYKARARGISVEQINPQYTSQRCSECGFTHEDNRHRESFFRATRADTRTTLTTTPRRTSV